jgi:hypothetical protein
MNGSGIVPTGVVGVVGVVACLTTCDIGRLPVPAHVSCTLFVDSGITSQRRSSHLTTVLYKFFIFFQTSFNSFVIHATLIFSNIHRIVSAADIGIALGDAPIDSLTQ